MSGCEDLALTAAAGVAPALRAVDCHANQTAANAFGRLFGPDGALLPALTILLTLYIAFFAISLLTGRSRIGVSALTPRMLTLGLVLTFATSWVAYQGFVWNLAVGAPDQLAAILSGTSGPATLLFADKLDIVFAAIARAADVAGQAGQAEGGGAAAVGSAVGSAVASAGGSAGGSMFTPVNLMWIAALILLLGTVGVLVTARIALALLLAIGPVFIVLALFSGTRGLFAGWLRGLVMTAVTPIFVVIGGGLMLELMVPVIAALTDGIAINGQAAIALFLIACVHAALMAMILKVTASIISDWTVFGLVTPAAESRTDTHDPSPLQATTVATDVAPAMVRNSARAPLVAASPVAGAVGSESGRDAGGSPARPRATTLVAGGGLQPLDGPATDRARGIGSRFRNASNDSGRALLKGVSRERAK